MRTEEIINKVFTRSFMGYDIEQVDAFLDEMIEALERYEAEKQEMLIAMEYLMRKLEHGQKMPLSDMKKAIGSGRPQQGQNDSNNAFESRTAETKAAARSITRGGATKSMRAPKISRVQAEQEAREKIIQQAQAEQPPIPPDEAEERAKSVAAAAANWLDELLINIAEHETSEYEKQTNSASTAQQDQNEESISQQESKTNDA